MKPKTIWISGLLALGMACPALAQPPEQCTTAIISPAASAHRVPVLWKNRDTGTLSNKVVYVEEEPFSYLGLVNADAPGGRRGEG